MRIILASKTLVAVTLALAVTSPSAEADPFKGDAQMTESTSSAAKKNPANAAFVRESAITFAPRLYEKMEFLIRYPGFPTVTKESSGVTQIQAISFIPTRGGESESKLGFALTEILPPITVNVGVDRIPLVVFEQLQFINIKAEAKVKGGLGGLVSYRFNRRFGIGLGAAYRKIGVGVDVASTETGETLANVDLDITQMELQAGVRFEVIPGKISLGLASVFFSQDEATTAFSSPLIDTPPAAGGGEGGAAPAPSYFKTITGGIGIHLNRLHIVTDVEYQRAKTGEKSISVVEFTEKYKDNYSSVSVRAGLGIDMDGGREFSLGYANVPATLGPGGRGEGSKVGFGLLDVIMVAAGLEDLKPYQTYVAGFRMDNGEKRQLVGRIKKRPVYRLYPTWTFGVGVGYQKASLGIDENGEQPGAYLQTKMFIPIEITYRF